jgi:threonine dehydrogenase-like Zn-dependent dehydrogenase
VQDARIDLTGMVTHRYPLEGWWDALRALARPEVSGVLKATFTPNGDPYR